MKKLPTLPSLELEDQARQSGFVRIAGVDEVGRGPLAGPVVVATVVLPDVWDIGAYPLNDSKKLSERQRERFFDVIQEKAIDYKIVSLDASVVDNLNILQAALLGMKNSVEGLILPPDYVLVDGNRYPQLSQPGQAVVKGDSLSLSIAAASILAKVTRDREMVRWQELYPQWGFSKHKGYPTLQHRQAVQQHGLSPIHRITFCRKLI